MAKKSVRARSPVKNEKKSPANKNSKTYASLKRSRSFPVVGLGGSSGGFEAFKTLAENAPDVIFRVDGNLRFVFVNQKIM